MQYPMDSTFVFNLCAVMAVGLYTASLILHVQVVGDFGGFGTAIITHCMFVI